MEDWRVSISVDKPRCARFLTECDPQLVMFFLLVRKLFTFVELNASFFCWLKEISTGVLSFIVLNTSDSELEKLLSWTPFFRMIAAAIALLVAFLPWL